jgi:hypothetical protein
LVRRPGDTTRASRAAMRPPNSRLDVDITDSADGNKASPGDGRQLRGRPNAAMDSPTCATPIEVGSSVAQ